MTCPRARLAQGGCRASPDLRQCPARRGLEGVPVARGRGGTPMRSAAAWSCEGSRSVVRNRRLGVPPHTSYRPIGCVPAVAVQSGPRDAVHGRQPRIRDAPRCAAVRGPGDERHPLLPFPDHGHLGTAAAYRLPQAAREITRTAETRIGELTTSGTDDAAHMRGAAPWPA